MKKIIFSIFAVAALLFTSCVKEPVHNGLDVLKVDKTFVTIDKLGGEATLTINAKADWHIVDSVVVKDKKVPVVEGLTISPVSGGEGETVVKFSAEARKKRVSAQFEIVCDGQSQFVVFSMQAGIPSPYPDFEAGEYWLMFKKEDGTWLASKHCTATIDDSGSYGYVSCEPAQGTFPKLTSSSANVFTFELVDKEDPDSGFVIKDVEGGYLYQDAAGKYNNFYRTSKKASAMAWTVEQESDTEFRIESTQAKWIQYSTGYSTWGAYNSKQDNALLPYLVKAEKVLIDLESTSVVLDKEDTTVVALAKINADQVSVDFDADWINYRGTNDKGFIFKVAENTEDARSAEVKIFASLTQTDKEGKSKTFTSEATLTIEQAGSIVECTVAEFLAQEVGSALYKLSGFITDRTDISGHKFDLVNYGNFDLTDATGNAYIYGVGAKGDIAKYGVKEGDIIELIGTRADYKGSPQMGGGQYVSHKSVTAVTATEAAGLADDDKADPKNYIRLTGKVTKPSAESGNKFDITTYGNFDLVDESGAIYVYGVSTGWKGETKKFSTLGVKEGDIITIVAYKTSYKGAAQVVGMYVSHESAE